MRYNLLGISQRDAIWHLRVRARAKAMPPGFLPQLINNNYRNFSPSRSTLFLFSGKKDSASLLLFRNLQLFNHIRASYYKLYLSTIKCKINKNTFTIYYYIFCYVFGGASHQKNIMYLIYSIKWFQSVLRVATFISKHIWWQ